ncbi:interferon-induced transmembrane protein 3-like isoform X2 [Myxocyprinus asiaticus]|uniref:interferon-induced transmembrane protein 3-like isoform X2 n=1 Tax=Myxocyprinus asiaticus TaxID=70543 RepID=UPI00222278E3|nr:interferon-induced transmembrane protein 3-like isoform X2 [Myxocyprinus asiaticus]
MQNSAGVPLQDNRGYTHQPVTVSMPEQTFNDDIVFSTFNLHFCNHCCLGFCAFHNSVKARDSRMRGDFMSAQSYGFKARCLNITAFSIGVIMIICLIILIYKFQYAFYQLSSLYYYQ